MFVIVIVMVVVVANVVTEPLANQSFRGAHQAGATATNRTENHQILACRSQFVRDLAIGASLTTYAEKINERNVPKSRGSKADHKTKASDLGLGLL